MLRKRSSPNIYPLNGLEPFITNSLPLARPDNNTIELIFNDLIPQLQLADDEIENLKSKSNDEKWEFVYNQQNHDQRIPSPESLLKALKMNVTEDRLELLASYISRGRKTWTERFIDSGGHSFLFSVISQIVARISTASGISKVECNMLLCLLCCFKKMLKLKCCVDKLMEYYDSVNIFVNSICPFIPKTVYEVFDICLSYLEQDNDPKHQGIILRLILESFRKLKREHHSWKIIKSILDSDPTPKFMHKLYDFLNGIYTKLVGNSENGGYPSFKFDWLIDLEKANIIPSLKSCSNDKLNKIAFELEKEIGYCKNIFSKDLTINPFNQKKVNEAILSNSDPKAIFQSIQLGLLDLSIQNREIFDNLLQFFYNTVNLTRYYNEVDPEDKDNLSRSIQKASELKNPIELIINETENPIYNELTRRLFIYGEGLRTQPIDDVLNSTTSQSREVSISARDENDSYESSNEYDSSSFDE